MLLSLTQWLQVQMPEWGFLRVFQYLTFRAVMAALTALLIGLVAGAQSHTLPHCGQDRSAGARVRDAVSPREVRDAHHGRRVGSDFHWLGDLALGGLDQPFCMDRFTRNLILWRDWLGG